MGNRVAELMHGAYGDRDSIGWAVYQSTSMAMFTPIFSNELAAELFAATLPDIFPDWEDMHLTALAGEVNQFLQMSYGERPEDHEDYVDVLETPTLFDEVVHVFRATRTRWAQEKAVKP